MLWIEHHNIYDYSYDYEGSDTLSYRLRGTCRTCCTQANIFDGRRQHNAARL